MFFPIISESKLIEGLFKSASIGDLKLLLIHHMNKTFIIENKCGHFGLPLETGYLEGHDIVCRQHGISFNLVTGEVSNRPYENCIPIKVFTTVSKDGFAGVDLL